MATGRLISVARSIEGWGDIQNIPRRSNRVPSWLVARASSSARSRSAVHVMRRRSLISSHSISTSCMAFIASEHAYKAFARRATKEARRSSIASRRILCDLARLLAYRLADRSRHLHAEMQVSLGVNLGNLRLAVAKDHLRRFEAEYAPHFRCRGVAQLVRRPAMIALPLRELGRLLGGESAARDRRERRMGGGLVAGAVDRSPVRLRPSSTSRYRTALNCIGPNSAAAERP